MPERLVVRIYWAGRVEGVDGYGARLHRWFTELGGFHRGMQSWRFGADQEASDAGACRDALVAGAESWELGEQTQTAYQARFYVGREVASPAEATITCGVEPLSLGSLFAPNGLNLAIRHDAPDDLATTEVVQAALSSAVTIFEAEFGHAGSDRVPTPAMALYSPGVPPVGWMTYLSQAYPPAPAKLPTPAVAYAAAGGSLVVAHPKPFREHNKSQCEAITSLRRVLSDAGVLRPWAEVVGRQP